MKKLLQQIIKFVGLSGIGWILDFTIYIILSFMANNLFINNIISSCIGSTFVFIFSTRLIFKNNTNIPLYAKYFLYIVYQIILIIFVSKILVLLNSFIISYITLNFILRFALIISKIIVTPITIILNFCVMKNVIERL